MQLVSFSNFHFSSQNLFYFLGKIFTCVATISQNFLNRRKIFSVILKGFQGAFSISNISSCDYCRMQKTLSVNSDVPFDSRNLFTTIVTFLFGCVGILHALGINYAKARLEFAPLFLSSLSSYFFFKTSSRILSAPGFFFSLQIRKYS